MSVAKDNNKILMKNCMAIKSSMPALVLAGAVFLIKFHLCRNQIKKKISSVTFGLVRLIILSYNE